MTTSNHPENLKTNEAHDLGQISIKTLLDNIEQWQERIADDMLYTTPPHDPQYHYLDGKYSMLDTVAKFLREPPKPKRYVVVEYPGTDREFQVFAANTYRDCHLWMNRHYTDDHCPAEIMVQLPNGQLSTEI